MTRGSVIVTGASTGIGLATALHLDRLGFAVVAGVRKEADADAVARQASARLTTAILDVTDAATIDELAAGLGDAPLAGLVNNAGIAVGGPLELVEVDELRRQLEINVVGLVAITQALLPALRRGTGRVVNIGSVGGRTAAPFLGPYSASKHAVEAITDSWRQELRPWGIHVAVVEPGSVKTPIWAKAETDIDAIEASMPAGGKEMYGALITAMRTTIAETAQRGMPPEKVAKAVEHALTAARPRTRYLLGADARAQVVLGALLPDRAMDALTARFLKLPR
jgi:NAD(P)-dependent dehydrogenase (short-subunit alcohol dehydrogenase family)